MDTGPNYLNTPPLEEIFTDLFAFVFHGVLVDELLAHIHPLLHWLAVLEEKRAPSSCLCTNYHRSRRLPPDLTTEGNKLLPFPTPTKTSSCST